MLAIYMVGSDLEDRFEAGTTDMWELAEGYDNLADKREVEVVVAFGGADKDGWRGMKFANMSQIMGDAQDGEFGDETGAGAYLYQDDYANMDDEDSLKLFLDYIKDGYANFDLRFLTLWDHGNSYMGFGGDSSDGYPYNDALYMDEIERAFTRSEVGEFDLIGFDACSMASVEVAKVIEPHADYMIASAELEPGHGWLWSEVIRHYAQQDDIVEAGKLMVDNYVQDVHEYNDIGKTLSLLDLNQYDQLVTALNPVISAYGQNLLSGTEYSDSLNYASAHVQPYGKTERGDNRVSIDLMDLALLLSENPPDTDTGANLNDLMYAIDRFVVHSNHDGSRPYSFGIAIDAPGSDESKYDSYKVSQAWLDFEDSYDEWILSDTASPQLAEFDSSADPQSLQFASDLTTPSGIGLSATFEDENLAEAVALYGFVEQVEFDDGTVDDYFMVVAELEAYPTETEGEYFIPEWDQWWFTVEYDPSQQTAWIPASFAGRFEQDGQEYTEYTAEIDFYPAGEDTYDFGVLTLIVDKDMEVVGYGIQTYQEFDDGTIRFDKASYEIIPGDAIQFYNFGFHLEDESQDDWFETGEGIVTFAQEPVFQLEFLEFEDAAGQLLEYYYAMWAEDASGNATLTDLVETARVVPTPFGNMVVFEDPWGYFQTQIPQIWIEGTPDASVNEVFRASDPAGNGAVNIYAEEGVQGSLTEYADFVESQIVDAGGMDVAFDYYDGVPEFWYEYIIGDNVQFWFAHLSDDGTLVDVIYTFPDDLYDTGSEIAYYSFDTFWVN